MKLLKDPFIHFLILGLLVFIANGVFNRGDREEEIIITQDDISRLQSLYKQNWNRAPDSTTLNRLIDDFIDSEILYREALRLNLDHNDEIVKRRLRQKFEFLAQDLADLNDPDESALKDYYDAQIDQYKSEKTITFFHYYFNPDRQENPVDQANLLLRQLEAMIPEPSSDYGDPIHINSFQDKRSKWMVSRDFGMEFANTLFLNDQPGWSGPIRSGLGIHIVYISEVIQERTLSLEEVSDQVLSDWKLANREAVNANILDNLRKKYTVIRSYEK